MRRVVVVGNSGSGKTTVAVRLAAYLGVPHVELDAIFQQPGWVGLDTPEFRRRVAEAADGDGWVADGNYSKVRDLLWARADTVVWLDYPRSVVLPRVMRRTLTRVVTRRELYNGNRESWRAVLSADPERSIILWSLTRHRHYHEEYAALLAPQARPPGLAVIRLGTPRQTRQFLADPSGHHPS